MRIVWVYGDSSPTLYSGYGLSSPDVKRPGRAVSYPAPSNAEVQERVELYLYPLFAVMASSRANSAVTLHIWRGFLHLEREDAPWPW